MKIVQLVIMTIVLVFWMYEPVAALRCGTQLANEGDLKYQVLLACGEPVSREVIGFIDEEKDGQRIRVLKLEEWIILVGDYYYSLLFEGNLLVKIEFVGEK